MKKREKIELVLLPPKEKREVSKEEIAYTYAKLISYLVSKD